MWLLASEVSADYYTGTSGIVRLLMLTMTYRQWPYIYRVYGNMYRVGWTTIQCARSLYRILVTATSLMDVTKMGNIVPRAGIEPTSLAFCVSVLPLHHIYPRPPAYVALCLKGQCRLPRVCVCVHTHTNTNLYAHHSILFITSRNTECFCVFYICRAPG